MTGPNDLNAQTYSENRLFAQSLYAVAGQCRSWDPYRPFKEVLSHCEAAVLNCLLLTSDPALSQEHTMTQVMWMDGEGSEFQDVVL